MTEDAFHPIDDEHCKCTDFNPNLCSVWETDLTWSTERS